MMAVLLVPSFNESETRQPKGIESDSEFNQTAMKRRVQCQSEYNEIVNTQSPNSEWCLVIIEEFSIKTYVVGTH